MSRRAQAYRGWGRRVFLWGSLRGAVCAFCALGAGACSTGGVTLERLAPDRSIVTGSIAPPPPPADSALQSDTATIRNAVSSAIVGELPPGGLGWANADTGARGTITAIIETRTGGVLCRGFEATRESFDGVHLHRGRACLGVAGAWSMQDFAPAQ